MAQLIPEQHQSISRDHAHDSILVSTQEVQPPNYVPCTHPSSKNGRLGLPVHAPISQSSIETKSFPKTSEASIVRIGSDSTLIAAPTNSSKGRIAFEKGVQRMSPPLWKIWWLEVASIMLSIIAFMSIIVVLYSYDQGPIPIWPMQITLNSLVAFFTTIAKSCFMIPVSVAISQAKWSWFLQDKPLYDLHVLDQASRGSLGSLLLLTRIQWKHFVVVGALLTIISALTSPITQLTINYPVRDMATHEPATVATVHAITGPEKYVRRRSRNALLLNTIPNSNTVSLVSCTTGNCTFDKFESLGLCVQVQNITSHLRVEKFENPAPMAMALTGGNDTPLNSSFNLPGDTIWKASLPDGNIDLVHQTGVAAVSEMLNWNETSVFRNDSKLMQTRIASLVMIYTTPIIDTDTWQEGQDDDGKVIQLVKSLPRHNAIEAIFHLCVQSFETKIQKGEEHTNHISSLADPVEQDPPFELKMNCTSRSSEVHQCETQKDSWNDTLSLRGPLDTKTGIKSTNFTASYRSMQVMASAIKFYMPGFARVDPEVQVHHSPGPSFYGFFDDVLFFQENLKNESLRDEKIKLFYERVAAHFSASLREVKANELQNSFNISGIAWREEAYVQVRWGWVTFLAIELLTAAVFLSITIIAQARDKEESRSVFRGLKDSALAALLALSGKCRVAAGDGVQHIGVLKEKAMGLKVRFDGNEIIPVQAIGIQEKLGEKSAHYWKSEREQQSH